MDQERIDQGGSIESSSNLDVRGGGVPATVIKSDLEDETPASVSGENGNPNTKSRNVLLDEMKVNYQKNDKNSWVIDVKSEKTGENLNLDGERVCRICHLSPDQSPDNNNNDNEKAMDLIELGCGCKDELGIAHSHCAEAWFKVKGNRLCEICGVTAKNVIGVGDDRFMAEWNERRSSSNGTTSSERRCGCWQGQPLWNFLMACLALHLVGAALLVSNLPR
ncbi:unnamed protein product [Ilex paraguariensis]|uniref:RING-CH-type domain-containing protein n=1 Tax=Ilex paraguariensis TaxID=185542 RepID=A0ABC8RT02_9AQUA